MIKKNDEIIDNIIDVGANGEGIVKRDEYVIFVPFALVGEKVRFKVLKVSKNIVFAKLLEVIEPSKNRVKPKCPVFSKCGGCHLQHVDYSWQLKIKENNVINCFNKIAGIKIDGIQTVGSDLQYRYRNKLQLPIVFNGEKNFIGFYAENSHRVVEIIDCYINKSMTKELITVIKEFLTKFNLKGYVDSTGQGNVREITVKEIGNKFIITLVWVKISPIGESWLVNALKEIFGENFSLYYNENPKQTNVIYGERFKLIYGAPEYQSDKLGIKFTSSVLSFMQVNANICDYLYKEVCENVSKFSPDTVIDAYSGAGLMTALLSRHAKKAIGIEIIKEATECADALAKANGLSDKMQNITAPCEQVLPGIVNKEKNANKKVAVVLDPPRKGCDIKVLNAIKESKIEKIVYVSCLPSSLARDVGILVGSLYYEKNQILKRKNYVPEYEIESIKCFDMFPQTKHVETLVVLQRK